MRLPDLGLLYRAGSQSPILLFAHLFRFKFARIPPFRNALS